MSKSMGYALAAALVMSGAVPALAATTPAAQSAAQKTADQDFGKVSADGQSALRDIHRVRLDIFDGQIDHAKTSIAKAISSLDKAQSDETVFTRAEADLKPPAAMQAKAQATASTSSATAGRTPVEWLPVDGAMTIGEDYTATPEKAAGVKRANEKLTKGDQKGAMDELKLANVDVDFLVEVAPLKPTMTGVRQASDELNAGKYYEANQSLKSIEDGMRFDNEVLVEKPQKTDAAHPAKSNG